ncbi:hypothetical protein [Desulforamulus aquiferis]|uniref:Uncharacterized protein n=1 Tax=Desulforamulus aquiferis TaxID=1397668 RepID=A0AAW7Z8U4_9FIRM|nr:hypothetical protein [Desulforamulus aquiferis]MDO7786094.1 hypothetical protein [Desulforamulus aquiferis]
MVKKFIDIRKKEDGLNELDGNDVQNIKLLVNYIFEYFNNYIHSPDVKGGNALHREKIDKYYQQLEEYEPEVREWLAEIYDDYGKQILRNVGSILKKDRYFFLYNKDSEFREVSYDCYSKLIKKLPFLKNQTEMLFLLIKDYQRIQIQRDLKSGSPTIPFISDSISEWIETTWTKYQIDLTLFVDDWLMYFSNHEKIWPITHRKKSTEAWLEYEYDYKQKSNLFNLDSLYRDMPKKPYTKGKKQWFEILMMHEWLHSFVDKDESYWQEYLGKTLGSIE